LLVQASYKKPALDDASSLEDFTPSDLLLLPEQPEPAASASGNIPADSLDSSSHLTLPVTSSEDGLFAVPDFSGKTMREVIEACLRLGLDPVLVGSSLATDQVPAAGSQVRRGARITVQFGTPSKPVPNKSDGGKSAKPSNAAHRHQGTRH
jgi:hypothetical protein